MEQAQTRPVSGYTAVRSRGELLLCYFMNLFVIPSLYCIVMVRLIEAFYMIPFILSSSIGTKCDVLRIKKIGLNVCQVS